MKIILDMKRVGSPEAAHAYLQRALVFPDYYGKNLDALYDLLSVWDRPAAFVLRLPETGDMAAYGQRLRRVFRDAAAANPRLTLVE